jgi:hypothetical protein
MPGLQHLKQFRDELDALGNELTIRTKRGEPVDVLDLPKNIAPDADDLSSVSSVDSSDIGSLPDGSLQALAD